MQKLGTPEVPRFQSSTTSQGSLGSQVTRLPIAERAAVLAELRQVRAALPAGPSEARERLVALERRLEAAQAEAEGSEVAS